MLGEPIKAGTRVGAKGTGVFTEPRELHLRIPALVRRACDGAQATASLARHRAIELRAERAQPAPESTERDAEVVESAGIGLVDEPEPPLRCVRKESPGDDRSAVRGR